MVSFLFLQVPDIIDNAYVIVEFENGSRGMLDLCMFAEGSKNEQEISVVGDIGKVNPTFISTYSVPCPVLADHKLLKRKCDRVRHLSRKTLSVGALV